jgi:thioredoxin reductase (NADPH)
MNSFDIVIVGGGPIGIACGLEAQKKGLSYLIIEKGCIVNSLYNYPVNMQFFSSSEKLEIDNIPFVSNEVRPKRMEALEYYRRIVSTNDLHIKLFEKVLSVENKGGYFQIKTMKDQYSATNIVIATGFYDLPNMMHIPGENLPKVSHYYKDPHYFSGQNVGIIGAKNSAVVAALECYRKGANVTLIIRGSEISDRVKYWIRPDALGRIEEGNIKVHYNTIVKEIREKHLVLENEEGEFTLENDYVLALTGYTPNTDFLEKMGIQLSADTMKIPSYNPDTMETNVKGLFLAGVICGGLETSKWFIENSRIHAKIIIKKVLNDKAVDSAKKNSNLN